MSAKNVEKTARKVAPLVSGELSTLTLVKPVRGATTTERDGETVDVNANNWETQQAGHVVIASARNVSRKYDAERKRWIFSVGGEELVSLHAVIASDRDVRKVEHAMSDMGQIGAKEKARREKARKEREAKASIDKLAALGLSKAQILEMLNQ